MSVRVGEMTDSKSEQVQGIAAAGLAEERRRIIRRMGKHDDFMECRIVVVMGCFRLIVGLPHALK